MRVPLFLTTTFEDATAFFGSHLRSAYAPILGFAGLQALFSSTFRYALVSLLDIAAADSRVKAADIAAQHNIPSRYLNNVLHDLRRLGLISSMKGVNGGYQLAKDPGEINLLALHQGLAGGAGFERPVDPTGGFLWLQQLEDRWLQELGRTQLSDVQALINSAEPPA